MCFLRKGLKNVQSEKCSFWIISLIVNSITDYPSCVEIIFPPDFQQYSQKREMKLSQGSWIVYTYIHIGLLNWTVKKPNGVLCL